MQFWLTVLLVWSLVLGLGWRLGGWLARRFPPPPPPGRDDRPPPSSGDGPHGVLGCPPLGSEFDRRLLPGVFADLDVPA